MSGQGNTGAPADEPRDRQLESLRTRIAEMSPRSTAAASRWIGSPAGSAGDVLPVPGCLAAVLPDGGLRRGTIVGCTRGSLLLALLAGATAAGKWTAVVGNPQLGLLALHEMGGRLDKLAHISEPGPDVLAVVAVLLDGMDVVVLDDSGSASASRVRAVAARVRSQSAVLIVTDPGLLRPDVWIRARPAGYVGLGRGRGCLTAINFDVRVSGRSGRSRASRVTLAKAGAVGVGWHATVRATVEVDHELRGRTG